MMKLASVTVLALLSLSPPQSRDAEIEALKREVAALKAQQERMQRDVQAILQLLQNLTQPRQNQAPELPGVIGSTINLDREQVMGAPGAKVTLVEVSDYHCPFCRRNTQQTFPQINAEYIKTGKTRYAFVHYPIAQLHPDAFRSHEAAACAGDQDRFWEMHTSLFAGAPVKDVDGLVGKASAIGLDVGKFRECLTSGRHAAAIRDSVARMERMGIAGTPVVLIGLTPPPGQPMKIVNYVYGAQPFPAFKAAIDKALAEAQ